MATKSRNNWLFVIWLFLFSFGVSGLLFVTLHGSQYIGKDYFDSDTFHSQLNEFTSLLAFFEAGAFTKEEVKEEITVSNEDIEEYRYRYGDLNEQLATIKTQYDDKITALKAEKNKAAAEIYIAERDKKLKDITQNFASDDYVKNKIIKETEQQIDVYFQEIEKGDRGIYNKYRKVFIYDLKDLNKDEVYRYKADALAEKRPLFTRSYPYKSKYLSSGDSIPYVDGVNEDVMNLINASMSTELQGKIAISRTAPATHPIIVEYNHYQAMKRMIYVYSLLRCSCLIN